MKVRLRLGINKLYINGHALAFPAAQRVIDSVNCGRLPSYIADIVSVLHVSYGDKQTILKREERLPREDRNVRLAPNAVVERRNEMLIKHEKSTFFQRVEGMRRKLEEDRRRVYTGTVSHPCLLRSIRGRIGSLHVSIVALLDQRRIRIVYRQGMVRDTHIGGFKTVISVRMSEMNAMFANCMTFLNMQDVREYNRDSERNRHARRESGELHHRRGMDGTSYGHGVSGRQAMGGTFNSHCDAVNPVSVLTPSMGSGMHAIAHTSGHPSAHLSGHTNVQQGHLNHPNVYGHTNTYPNHPNVHLGHPNVHLNNPNAYQNVHQDVNMPRIRGDPLEMRKQELIRMLRAETDERERRDILIRLDQIEMKQREMIRMYEMRRSMGQPPEPAKKEVRPAPMPVYGGHGERAKRGEHALTGQGIRREPINQPKAPLVQKDVIMRETSRHMENEYDDVQRDKRNMGMRSGCKSTEMRSRNVDMRDAYRSMDMKGIRVAPDGRMYFDAREMGMPEMKRDRMRDMPGSGMRMDVAGNAMRMDMRTDRMDMPGSGMKMDMPGSGMRMDMRTDRMDMHGNTTRMDMHSNGTRMDMGSRRMYMPDMMVDGKNTINPQQLLETGHAPVRGRPRKKTEERGVHVPVRGRPRTKNRSPADRAPLSRSEELRMGHFYGQMGPYAPQHGHFDMPGTHGQRDMPYKPAHTFPQAGMMTPHNFSLQNVQNLDGEDVPKGNDDDEKIIDMPDFHGMN